MFVSSMAGKFGFNVSKQPNERSMCHFWPTVSCDSNSIRDALWAYLPVNRIFDESFGA
jgi:hypothetical protein